MSRSRALGQPPQHLYADVIRSFRHDISRLSVKALATEQGKETTFAHIQQPQSLIPERPAISCWDQGNNRRQSAVIGISAP